MFLQQASYTPSFGGLGLSHIEQSWRRRWIGKVRLQRGGLTTRHANRLEYVLGVGGAVPTVSLGHSQIGLILKPKIGDEHLGPTLCQSASGRCADAAVSTSNQSDVVAKIEA